MRRCVILAIAALALSATLPLGCSPETRQFDTPSPSGTGGSGGGTGGSAPIVEDCLNGEDDDGDGKRDCDDEDCGEGYACVSLPPDGWSGPAALYIGPSDAPPSCPEDFPSAVYNGYLDLLDEPAQCSACACDPASVKATCSPQEIALYVGKQCSGSVKSNPQSGIGCTIVFNAGSPSSYAANPPGVTFSGACEPSGGEPMVAPPAWATVALACEREGFGKGCGAQVCAPKGRLPFQAPLCVWREGDQMCPEAYSVKQQVLTDEPGDVVDARGCSPCACGKPTGTCSAATTLFQDQNCKSPIAVVPNDGACVEGLPGPVQSLQVDRSGKAGCKPSGGEPMGTVAPALTKVTTVCCAP